LKRKEVYDMKVVICGLRENEKGRKVPFQFLIVKKIKKMKGEKMRGEK
jgi:hypothetical protein